ncbi:heat shock 70 kDa cognate 4 [Brachionus plicatilis]|uniref:Heat shock 70 kDa cognate 4 n=1 Tax=Brachionus plicatilis TaxID=10195 RepID=A0A3M7Q2F9_BRAPC|nr:heat shock 70 kDa cognate 4 [Brachionus plicatilis]
MNAVLGIDLGTAKTCAGLVCDLKYSIVETPDGRQLINYVTLKESLKYGNFSKNSMRTGWNRTLYDSKILLQKSLDDRCWEENRARWPFETHQRKIKMDERILPPEEVMSMFLTKIKEISEQKFQTKINKAIITCPFSFNDSDRQSIIKSANLAGLEVARLLNDTTSACIDIAHKSKAENTFMVFNLGAYYLNLSICEVRNGHVRMIAAESYGHLGGEVMDQKMAIYICQKLKIQMTKKIFQALLIECEKAKISLSDCNKVDIQITSILEHDTDLEYSITRDEFDSINQDLFDSCLGRVKELLKKAKLDTKSICELFFVGGCSRIPKLKSILSQYFEKSINLTLNVSESVTHGAVILAGFLSGQNMITNNGSVHQEISSQSYELRVNCVDQEEFFKLVIPKYCKLPVEKDVFIAKKKIEWFELILFENNRIIWKNKMNFNSNVLFKLSLDLNGNIGLSASYIDSENNENEISLIKLEQIIKTEQYEATEQKDTDTIKEDLIKRINNLINYFSQKIHENYFRQQIHKLESLLKDLAVKDRKKIDEVEQELLVFDEQKNSAEKFFYVKEQITILKKKWCSLTENYIPATLSLKSLSDSLEFRNAADLYTKVLSCQNEFKLAFFTELNYKIIYRLYRKSEINYNCFKSITEEIERQKVQLDLYSLTQNIENNFKNKHLTKDDYERIVSKIKLLEQ